MASSLQNKIVVITGASSGIGRAAARVFARHGMSLVLAARNRDALQAVVRECEQRGGHAIAVPTDVTNTAAVEALAGAAERAYGHIDVWINNAGVTHYGRFEETPPAAFRQVIETNLFGYVHGARAVVPRFRRQGYGILINVASGFAIVGQPLASAYTASKFAIRGLSESLRQELADVPAVQVCTVLPAAINTPIYQNAGNLTGQTIRPVDPVYPVGQVAFALLQLVKRPQRELFVGAAAKWLDIQKRFTPGITERLLGWAATRLQFSGSFAPRSNGNLYISGRPAVEGGWRETSKLSRWAGRGLIMAGVALGIAMIADHRLRSARSVR